MNIFDALFANRTPGILPGATGDSAPMLESSAQPSATPMPAWMQRLNSPQAQIGLAMLANSRDARGAPTGLGQTFGQSVLGYQQQQRSLQDDALRRQLMQAQMIHLLSPPPRQDEAPVAVMGPDGKPVYSSRSGAIGKTPYEKPTGSTEQAGAIQEYAAAKNTGFTGSFLDFMRQRALAGSTPTPSFSGIPLGDGTYGVLDARTGQIRPTGQKAPPNAGGAVPQEGERTAASYFGRMDAAEKKLGTYVPSTMDYLAADKMMNGGPIMSSIGNAGLSQAGQNYYQAASDWIRAKLRKESGAVISPQEMAQDIKQYFPMPGDTKAVIVQKAQSRAQALAGMREMGGRAVSQLPGTTSTLSDNDPLGIR